MSGYAQSVIKIDFPGLSKDPERDPIWVVIKNPKLLPPKMLRPGREAQAAAEAIRAAEGSDGQPAGAVSPEDAETAQNGTYMMAGRLVIAWRVYDPASSPEIDPLTGEEVDGTGQSLLPSPQGGGGASAEQFGGLPLEIQLAVMRKITEAVNPQSGPEGLTQKMSSGQPNPSSTEPGAETGPQES